MTSLFREIPLGPRSTRVEYGANGALYLTRNQELGPYPRCLGDRLVHWAATKPDQTYLAMRGPDRRWRRFTYGETLRIVRNLGQALLDHGLSPTRPLMILSGNDLNHALLALAALHVGVPFSPISPAYALISRDFGKLRSITELLKPGMVYAADSTPFAAALRAVIPADATIVLGQGAFPYRPSLSFETLATTEAGPAVDAAFAAITGDTLAKVLFTSGSTGMPKGVMNTQRMLCSNQAMVEACYPFLAQEPPILVDWLPWNHTYGGNKNFNMALYHGGSFYIDEGRPVPGMIERSLDNLREISPSVYFNVPKGFEALLPFLKRDPALCQAFFKNLRFMFYGGAGMSLHIWREFEAIALAHLGQRVMMMTSLGSTETAPVTICANWDTRQPGMIGLPVAGAMVKLVPTQGKLEIRVRGPNVMPGYYGQPELTAKAFDEEGFFSYGDAVRLVDPDDINQGLMFDGRLSEDFKLATGTWVNAGALRSQIVAACAPYLRDIVIAGHDRDELSGILFLDLDSCRSLNPESLAEAGLAEAVADPILRAHFQDLLHKVWQAGTGSATRITRWVLADTEASIDLGEITDKGSLAPLVILRTRAALVEDLYTATPSASVQRVRL